MPLHYESPDTSPFKEPLPADYLGKTPPMSSADDAASVAVPDPGTWFGADDQYLFNAGDHTRLWDGLGGRLAHVDGVGGARFAVWAPNAASVSVIGDFNGWTHPGEPLRPVGASGVWDGFIPGLSAGSRYKYRVESSYGTVVEKADPMAFESEIAPNTASVLADLTHTWSDDAWMASRHERNRWDQPISIYDSFALNAFDGSSLYEHADPREGFHPDWKSSIFNYGRHEVRSFLLSSARFWLEAFHIDGIRVDAVASMLYRDYSRGDDWIPNEYGGRENLEAITFLQQLNHEMYSAFPDILMIAEESTAWPGVTRPTDQGGLGFGYKWDMGWMNDTLEYFQEDPINRRYHHNKLTFRAIYGFSENFVLPLSHDEVVHGKGSLLNKMPGDDWQKFANLRMLLGWQYGTPGKKLLFMGSEVAPWTEWNHDESIPWHLTGDDSHEGVLQWVASLNHAYSTVPALHALDTDASGFRWIDANDDERSVITFLREDGAGDMAVIAMNATPVPRDKVMTGVPVAGKWDVLLCSDGAAYGGSAYEYSATYETTPHHHNSYEQSIWLTLPPLSLTILRLRP